MMKGLLGLVLGSGLGALVDHLTVDYRVGFGEVGLPESSVPGHQGEFVIGKLSGVDVVIMRGRVHLYEGLGARAVTAGVRWMQEQGVTDLVLTNAAGSLNEAWVPGSWMRIHDHLNMTGCSPLEGGPNFVDLSEVYDQVWGDLVQSIAERKGVALPAGVYAGLRGPQYETPAEIRMLRVMGADAVGMSTVLEAIQARALGMKVLGLSCLTNFAAGMPGATLDHEEVIETGRRAAAKMIDVIIESLKS
ncbi:MAG: purine-nucleoside phosphorylase [Verrucomicrobiales bacterium]